MQEKRITNQAAFIVLKIETRVVTRLLSPNRSGKRIIKITMHTMSAIHRIEMVKRYDETGFCRTHLLLTSWCTLTADSHLGLQLLELLGIHALTSLPCVEEREVTGREGGCLKRNHSRDFSHEQSVSYAWRPATKHVLPVFVVRLEKMEAYASSLDLLRQSGLPA